MAAPAATSPPRPQGPAGDTGAHDTRAATRGRRTAATSPRDARLRAPGWAGTGIPRDARSLPCAGIQANRAEPRGRNSGGAVRPHPRGWRHTRARGSVTTRVGAGMPTPCGKRRQERRRRHPSGQHPAAFAWARAGRHARSAFPGLGGRRRRDIERWMRDTPKAPRLPPRRG